MNGLEFASTPLAGGNGRPLPWRFLNTDDGNSELTIYRWSQSPECSFTTIIEAASAILRTCSARDTSRNCMRGSSSDSICTDSQLFQASQLGITLIISAVATIFIIVIILLVICYSYCYRGNIRIMAIYLFILL